MLRLRDADGQPIQEQATMESSSRPRPRDLRRIASTFRELQQRLVRLAGSVQSSEEAAQRVGRVSAQCGQLLMEAIKAGAGAPFSQWAAGPTLRPEHPLGPPDETNEALWEVYWVSFCTSIAPRVKARLPPNFGKWRWTPLHRDVESGIVAFSAALPSSDPPHVWRDRIEDYAAMCGIMAEELEEVADAAEAQAAGAPPPDGPAEPAALPPPPAGAGEETGYRFPGTRAAFQAVVRVGVVAELLGRQLLEIFELLDRTPLPEGFVYRVPPPPGESPAAREPAGSAEGAALSDPLASRRDVFAHPFDAYHRAHRMFREALDRARSAVDAAAPELDAGVERMDELPSMRIAAVLSAMGGTVADPQSAGPLPTANARDAPERLWEQIQDLLAWENRLRPFAHAKESPMAKTPKPVPSTMSVQSEQASAQPADHPPPGGPVPGGGVNLEPYSVLSVRPALSDPAERALRVYRSAQSLLSAVHVAMGDSEHAASILDQLGGLLAAQMPHLQVGVREVLSAARLSHGPGGEPIRFGEAACASAIEAVELLGLRLVIALAELPDPPLENSAIREALRRRCPSRDELAGLKVRLAREAEAVVAALNRGTAEPSPSGGEPAGSAANGSNAPEAEYLFHRRAGGWRLRYADEQWGCGDMDGMFYIATLLRTPGIPVLCTKLYDELAMFKGRVRETRSGITEPQAGAAEHAHSGDRDPQERTLNDEGLAELNEEIRSTRENIASIEAEIAEASRAGDEPQQERLTRDELHPERDKLNALLKRWRADTGLGGRPRLVGQDEVGRARQKVQKAIAAAINAITDAGLHRLGEHLRSSIPAASGGQFVYRTDAAPHWEIDLG